MANTDFSWKSQVRRCHGFWLLNMCNSEHTPEEKHAWAPGVLQPSLVLLESGDVYEEN